MFLNATEVNTATGTKRTPHHIYIDNPQPQAYINATQNLPNPTIADLRYGIAFDKLLFDRT